MKIAMICQPWDPMRPPVTSGSVAIWVYEVSRRLARQGAEVTIFAQQVHGDTATEHHDGVEYRRVPLGRTGRLSRLQHHLLGRPSPRRPYFASPFFCRDFITAIAREIRERKFDVVHIQNYSQFVPIVRKLNPDVRIILHMRCEWLLQLDCETLRERISQADLLLSVGAYLTCATRQRFAELNLAFDTLGEGIDVAPDPPAGTRTAHPIILFVSRVSPEKGVHVLLRAFERVHREFPNARLRIIGPPGALEPELMLALSDDPLILACEKYFRGDYMAMLKAEMTPAVAAAVEFLGHVPHNQLPPHYRSAALLVAPSLSEAFGRAVIEAMSCGTPVVGSRIGGIAETVQHGETGLLVPANDPDALAEAILDLLRDPDRRLIMGAHAWRRAHAIYSWQSIAAQTRAYYEELLGEGTRASRDQGTEASSKGVS